LLNDKSTSEVFLAPFWYVNVESKVGEPTSLIMLELMIRLRTPSATRDVATLTLGLQPRQRAIQKGDPRDVSYSPRSAGKCERMNLHTPKATPTWGVGVSKDSQIFKEWL
jgi:hypothetical protein